ncbi:MAG: tripartite tricarboxylate transporter TctB family protein [Deltaproteobacteria bacterium]|nr:tripartite tricarboxylate transporter TctB family protein [Deltaproteobacteria bacterium]
MVGMNAIKKKITRTQVEGLVILLVAIGYLWEAQNVPLLYQVPGVPGPTTFPWLLGIVFGLSGVWLLVSPHRLIARLRKEAADEDEDAPEAPAPSGAAFWDPITRDWHFYTIWAVILGYLVLMPSLGFPVATALLLAMFVSLLGEQRWWVVAGLALVATTVIYTGFALGLRVRLPLGVLEPLVK